MSVAGKCFGSGARLMLLAVLGAFVTYASAHEIKGNARLPVVGPAPEFALTTQSGERLSLTDLRGKVLAVTFIYATCKDTCPILTAKMATLQQRLGADFGPRVRFVSVTVEPEVDTPAVLKRLCRPLRRRSRRLELSDRLGRPRSTMSCGATARSQSG